MSFNRQSLCKNPVWCHICGLQIPNDVVSRTHPLFGTVDHIVPLACGGENVNANRAPAHRLCNNRKGNGKVDNPLRVRLQADIQKELEKLQGKPLTKRQRRHAIALLREGER